MTLIRRGRTIDHTYSNDLFSKEVDLLVRYRLMRAMTRSLLNWSMRTVWIPVTSSDSPEQGRRFHSVTLTAK